MTRQKIGIVLGISNMIEIFKEEYYSKLKGGILESFSTLFSRNAKLYVYPMKKGEEIITCANFPIEDHLKFLYQYLLSNNKIEDIQGAEIKYLDIYSDKVISMIKSGEKGWEKMVPELVHEAITKRELFGYKQSEN